MDQPNSGSLTDDRDLSLESLKNKFGPQGALLDYLLIGISRQIKKFKVQQTKYFRTILLVELATALLGAAATIMIGIDKFYAGFAVWAIIPTSLVTVAASLSAFYNQKNGYTRATLTKSRLSTLQHEVQYDIRTAVIFDGPNIDKTYIDHKFARLDSILQDDLTRFFNDASHENKA